VIVTNCLLKCLVYRGGGKEGQFLKVNYHIQSRLGIMIIVIMIIELRLVSSKTDTARNLE